MEKDLKDKAVKIKGKLYVEVKERILYLAKEKKDKYSITTEYDYFPERFMWVVKATLKIGESVFTGLAQEIEPSEADVAHWREEHKKADGYDEKKKWNALLNQVNRASALENCETSAIGRACAMAGIGVIDGIASTDEINKHNNRPPSQGASQKSGVATDKQKEFAKRLLAKHQGSEEELLKTHTGKESVDVLTFTEARKLIDTLLNS